MRKNFTLLSLLFVALLSGTLNSFGQQDPYYSHFMYSKLAYNPAVAGDKDGICATILGHNQWTGLKELNPNDATNNSVNPFTSFASVTAPINIGNYKSGIGFVVVKDNLGYEASTNVKVSYAQKFNIQKGQLSVGLDVGYLQASLDGKKLFALNPNDPNIPTGTPSDGQVDVGAGVYYKNPELKNLFVGFSMTHLNKPSLQFAIPTGAIDKNYVMHSYLVAGIEHELNPDLKLIPTVLIKNRSLTQFEANASVLYQDKFRGGIGFRTLPNTDAATIMLGYHISQNFVVGYSYDITLNGLNSYSSGTHEIMANYCFKIPTVPPKEINPIVSPRFL